jgi:hypothetical protein
MVGAHLMFKLLKELVTKAKGRRAFQWTKIDRFQISVRLKKLQNSRSLLHREHDKKLPKQRGEQMRYYTFGASRYDFLFCFEHTARRPQSLPC